MVYDCIIIGAGASGLMCAAAMEKPVRGLVLEKTKRPGTKLLMSGSGQCNITHSGSIKDFIPCYGKNGGKIRNSLYKYNNLVLIQFLEENGIKTLTRDDGKVFPASMDSSQILELLLERSRINGFEFKYESPVSHIYRNGSAWIIETCGNSGKNSYTSKNIVIASGGCSYPTTGSDGSFFKVLRNDLNINITELKPALSSIQVLDYPYGELSGISFENVLISILPIKGKPVHNEGSLLFTHKDISGPAILNISKHASVNDVIKINYLYPLNYEQALQRLKKAVQGSKTGISNIISDSFGLPKRFCKLITERYGNSLKKLTAKLTGEEFSIASTCGFKKAMTTSGGIEISQINTSTMEFKEISGVFAIGEVLDIDGITGGYNLQFAFSSAKSAGAEIIHKYDSVFKR